MWHLSSVWSKYHLLSFLFNLFLIFSLLFCLCPMNLMQVIDDDSGLRMRPMPGMFDMKTTGSTVHNIILRFLFSIKESCFYFCFMCTTTLTYMHVIDLNSYNLLLCVNRRKKLKPRGRRRKELDETLKKWRRSCLGSLRNNQIGHWNNLFRRQISLRYANCSLVKEKQHALLYSQQWR